MSTYLLIDGKEHGPYSIGQLQGLLSSSKIPGESLAWQEGMREWQPVSALLSKFRPDIAPVLPTPHHPGLGVASFVISIAGVVGWFILLVVAGAGSASGVADTHPLMIAVGLFLFLGLGLNLMGAILGIVSISKSNVPKGYSIIGVSLNLAEMVGIGLLTILGMASNS